MRSPRSPEARFPSIRTLAGIFLLVVAAAPAIHGQSLRTLRAEFTRTTTSTASVETVRGTLFFEAPDLLILVVREPVLQWAILETGRVTFWYPDVGKAWRFTEKSPKLLGLSSLFVAEPRADFGLAAAGFSLAGSETQNGVLRTWWEPPSSIERTTGILIVESRDNRPFQITVQNPRGDFRAQVSYAYTFVGEVPVPEYIEVTQEDRGQSVTEKIAYSGYEINGDLPAEIAGFRLPPDAALKDIAW